MIVPAKIDIKLILSTKTETATLQVKPPFLVFSSKNNFFSFSRNSFLAVLRIRNIANINSVSLYREVNVSVRFVFFLIVRYVNIFHRGSHVVIARALESMSISLLISISIIWYRNINFTLDVNGRVTWLLWSVQTRQTYSWSSGDKFILDFAHLWNESTGFSFGMLATYTISPSVILWVHFLS